MDSIMITGLIINFALAFIPAKIASDKGRSFGKWYLYGFLLFIVALIHAAVLKAPEKPEKSTEEVILSQSSSEISSVDMPSKIDVNALVIIKSYSIVKRNDVNCVDLYLKNFSEKNIIAVKIKVKGYNAFDEVISNGKNTEYDVLIQDLNLPVDSTTKGSFVLKGELENARKFEFQVTHICHNDNTIEVCKQPLWIETKKAPYDIKYRGLYAGTNRHGEYYYIDYGDYWQCTCGYVNSTRDCRNCYTNRDKAMKYSVDKIEDTYQKYLEEQEEAEKKSKRDTKLIYLFIAGWILIVAIIVAIQIYWGNTDRKMGRALSNNIEKRLELSQPNTEEDYELLIATEDTILKFDNSNFENEQYQNYISGLKKQKEALQYYSINRDEFDSLWKEGEIIRCNAAINLCDSGEISLSDKSYAIMGSTVLLKEIENSIIGSLDICWDDNKNLFYYNITVNNVTNQDFENVIIKIFAAGIENTYTIDNWESGGGENFDVYFGNDINDDGSIDISYYFESYQYKSYTYSNN